MLKAFPIEFVRQLLEQTLLEEHIKNPNFFGGENQIKLTSFYEQLKNQNEVDRFVETIRDLSNQQNRTGLIGNGVILSPDNPSITNIYSNLIIPMNWTCSIRCTLENRDQMIETLYNLTYQLKGKKFDIAQLECEDENGKKYYAPFKVGTMGRLHRTQIGQPLVPAIINGDFIGNVTPAYIPDFLANVGIASHVGEGSYLYYGGVGAINVAVCENGEWKQVEESDNYSEIIFPPTHYDYEKFKLSISLESFRCDEPNTLNGKEYCEISFGGSATIVSESVRLGNDMLCIDLQKKTIIGNPDISINGPHYYLEPLELSGTLNSNQQFSQLLSNNFATNTHTDSISRVLQYSFVVDNSSFINQLFNYARFGTYGTTSSKISPNMIYELKELWSSWGEIDYNPVLVKLSDDIDIENTESDTLTIGLTFHIQGANH